MKNKIISFILTAVILVQTIVIMTVPSGAWTWADDGKYRVASYDASIVKDGAITVDAKLDHVYLGGTKIVSNSEGTKYIRGGYDAVKDKVKGEFVAYVAADTKGLYIYTEIMDDTIFATTDDDGNTGDYLNIYFDWCSDADNHPTPEERLTTEADWSDDEYMSSFGKDQQLGWLSADYYGKIKGSRGFQNYTQFGPSKNQAAQYEARFIDGGWACEWFIPWRNQSQSIAIANGEQFNCGIGFQVGDDTDIGDVVKAGEKDVGLVFDQRNELGLGYYNHYSRLADLKFVSGHSVSTHVCTYAGIGDVICDTCGEIVKEGVTASVSDPESHVYVPSADSRAASCEEDGAEVFECKYCNTVETTQLPAFGHSYEFNRREAKHICTVCRERTLNGDVNGDGDITNADVLIMFRAIYDPMRYPVEYAEIGDVNGDGAITNADVLIMFRNIYDPETYPTAEKLPEVNVGGINLADYVLIYPEENSLGEKELCETIASRIEEKYGLEPEIYADSMDVFENEIIIGKADRNEADAAYSAAFEYNQYSVSVEENKITLAFADNKFASNKAAEDLCDMITRTASVKSKKVTATADKLLSSACFSDSHNCFTMLEPTNSTGDYVLRKTHSRAVNLIRERYGLVDIVMVGGDLTSDYPRWDESGWWPYKYYVEYKQLIVDQFASLAKDEKVIYVAGNHDYGQGEAATDGPGIGGSYNSSEFYFTGPMITTMGELDEQDMHMVTGTHTGEKYLLGYHYELNGVHFIGVAPDPDHSGIWSKQGYGFHPDTLAWFKETLERIDPNGDEVIFVNCHFHLAYRVNDVISTGQADKDILPIIKGHSNLFWMFGHVHTGVRELAQSHTSEMIVHYDKNGNTINTPGIATSYAESEGRGPSTVYMGAGRISYDSQYFNTDKIYGYGGYTSNTYTYSTTATPTVCQVMYFTVYEDRVEFQSVNVGTYEGYTEKDIIEPYTVYFYK